MFKYSKQFLLGLSVVALSLVCTHAQNKRIDVIGLQQKDSSLNGRFYNECQVRGQALGLKDIRQSKKEKYLRFWTNSQAIDVWISDGKVYGQLCNYTFGDTSTKRSKDGKPIYGKESYFVSLSSLDSSVSPRVLEILDSLYMYKIPPLDSAERADSIKGLRYMMLDGDDYQVEYSTKDLYLYRCFYDPPKLYDEAEKAWNELNELIHLRDSFLKFRDNLPHDNYRNGIMSTTQ